MEYKINDIITLNGTLQYVVCDIVKLNNINYLYLINNELDNDDCALMKEVIDGDDITLESITDEDEFDRVFSLIAIKNKNEIMDSLNNKE